MSNACLDYRKPTLIVLNLRNKTKRNSYYDEIYDDETILTNMGATTYITSIRSKLKLIKRHKTQVQNQLSHKKLRTVK